MEVWNDADWVGEIRVYPANEQYVNDLDDYDERKRGKSQWEKSLE